MKKIKRIYAFGTRGKALNVEFDAVKNINGKFELNRKKDVSSNSQTNLTINKVEVDTLEEAYRLLKTEQYLINLKSQTNSRALREYKKCIVIR